MAKPDLNTNLVPFLIAGLLSGSLSATFLRPGGATKGAGASTAAEADGIVAAGPSSWVADLNPVLDALSAALSAPGESAEQAAAHAMVAAAGAKTATSDEVVSAMGTLRKGLDDAESAGTDCGAADRLTAAAGTLGGYLLTTGDGEEKSVRYGAAKVLLDEYRGWRRLTDLAQRVKESKERRSGAIYDVDFIVATVPDYVDSNSGWLADEALAAIQSSMVRNRFVLDRPQLVDWSRSTARADGLASMSRLHERQPGALLFRKVDPDPADDVYRHVQLQVVLLVLETPTAGVHHAALRSAAALVRAWKRCTGESRRVLRVLGPSFSGSTLSLAIVLNEIRGDDTSSFQETWVVSGSATADSNVKTMETFAPGVNYLATVLTTSVLEKRMAAFLGNMNPWWREGHRVALLTESNTAYGQNRSETEGKYPHPAFPLAKIFKFPLHVAQLWSDAPEPSSAPLFGPGPIVPLNLREAAPPSDQIPALRPALTSAVVASTVESILDAIRHERLSAVGIVATDNRDALFLAREVKRSSPDVQLFFFGTHALYLHPDYVPYLRGALVASSYSLALANQAETKVWWPRTVREPFQSQSSEGVFNATRALLTVKEGGGKLDDCAAQATFESCIKMPQATINVIGEDGYWTLPWVPTAPVQGEPPAMSLPPLPLRAILAGLIVIGFVALHIFTLRRIRNDLRQQAESSQASATSALEWPIVRMFAPPRTVRGAARNHLRALRVCLVFLGLASAWMVVTTAPFMVGVSSIATMLTGTLAVAAFALTVVPAWTWVSQSRKFADDIAVNARPVRFVWNEDGCAEAPSHMTPVAKLLFLTLILTLGSFAAVIVDTLLLAASPDARALMLARYVGGGVVSPAALTLFTLTAVYAALITGLRRLSLVGYGYAALTARSPAFSLLTGDKPPESKDPAKPSQFACILDMPAQNLPAPYLSAVVATSAVALLCLLRTSTFDGILFAIFLGISSVTILAIGLLLLAQGLATWSIARAHLTRLVHSPIEARLASVASYVPWDISLSSPKLTQLMPLARMADGVIREFRRISDFSALMVRGSQTRRAADGSCTFTVAAVAGGPVRKKDLRDLDTLFAAPSHVEDLTTEMKQRQCTTLIQSDSWRRMWELSDAVVSAMQRSAWQRAGVPADRAPVLERADSRDQPPRAPAQRPQPDASWFERCERLVALQLAFVLRDIVARTVTCLFAAMLCLTLLTAAHLLYSFNGRNTLLTIDMLAVAATAVVSVWILVDMERDHILSRLRTTTPGRVDINWDFFKRVAVYGVLPLLIVIASLFPEVGGTLFGWLDPLRKLSSF